MLYARQRWPHGDYVVPVISCGIFIFCAIPVAQNMKIKQEISGADCGHGSAYPCGDLAAPPALGVPFIPFMFVVYNSSKVKAYHAIPPPLWGCLKNIYILW